MASKSKRRGRVFRASCILAALIIAGSSFAWFTSKDEVTNRLTATSDYGVSIVESFVPPANWLPGQAINKDVYAVNTGNVAAFVNEDISGVLNYTYEQKTKDLSDKCVILNDVENGAVTYEAGGFLAWTDAKVTVPKYTIGDKEYEKATVVGITASSDGGGTDEKVFTIKYSAAGQPDYYATADEPTVLYTLSDTNDTDDVPFDKYTAAGAGTTVTEGTKKSNDTVDLGAVNVLIGEENGWKPTEEGAYIFRRAIKNDINPGKGETYTYSGFYFVPAGANVHWTTTDVNVKAKDGNNANELTFIKKYSDGTNEYYAVSGAEEAQLYTLSEDGKTYTLVTGETPTTIAERTVANDTYYKIIIGNDKYATTVDDNDLDGIADIVFDIYADQAEVQTLGATINEDGTINGIVDYNFVEVESTGNKDVTLVMDREHNRLIAVYSKAAEGDGGYDASAVAARAEVDYENAQKLSDLADTLYGYAQADVAYATKLAEERNKLIDAANATQGAHDALDAADATKDDAWDDVEAELAAFNSAYQAFTSTGSPNNLSTLNPVSTESDNSGAFVPAKVITAANLKTDGTNYDYPQVHNNYEELKTLYTNMTTAKGKIDAAITLLESYNDETDPATVQAQLKIIKDNLDLLNNPTTGYLKQYKDKYADIVSSVNTDTTITIQTVESDDQKNRIQAVSDLCTTAKGKFDSLQVAEDGYKDAYDAWQTEVTNARNQDADWEQALADYNTNVGNAKSKYEEAIASTPADNNGQDHAVAIVAKGAGANAVGYSLTNKGATDTKDPTINLTASGATDYATYKDETKVNVDSIADNLLINYHYTTTEKNVVSGDADNYSQTSTPVTTTDKKLADWATFKSNNNTAAAEARQDYTDAVSTLQGTSDIMIYINLANDAATATTPAYNWEDAWTFDESTNNSKKASFYYNKVLEPGATTEKLVDSVELANTVKATDYKDLTFDLNVAMDSAQVTYEDDQRTYTANAVQQDAFGMKVASIENNEDVTWENYDAAAMVTQYKLGNNVATLTKISMDYGTPSTTYTWLAKVGDDYYVATSRSADTVFTKANMSTDADGNPTGITSLTGTTEILKVERVAAPTTP